MIFRVNIVTLRDTAYTLSCQAGPLKYISNDLNEGLKALYQTELDGDPTRLLKEALSMVESSQAELFRFVDLLADFDRRYQILLSQAPRHSTENEPL